MKIELSKELLHAVQLVNAKLIKLDCENINISNKIEPEKVQVDFETSVNIIDEKEGKLRLKVIVQEEDCFRAVVEYEGEFKVIEEAKAMSTEALEMFLEIQAIPLLLSYVRETMNNAFMKMEIDMNMPVIDMNKIYSNYLATQE